MSGASLTDGRVEQVLDVAHQPDDHDELVQAVAHCQTVLIGESTHGTDEFYRERAAITRRLIEEHGFCAVAIEGDWPDAWQVHRYVTGRSPARTAGDALAGFQRFPSWMWRNSAMLDFVGWLGDHNAAREPAERCGVYGLDLYSMHASAECVLRYLEDADPHAVSRARERYECLDGNLGAVSDPQRYAQQVLLGLRPHCEREILEQLMELTHQRARLVSGGAGGIGDGDEAWFDAQQNALVVRNAERYYRTMFKGNVESWNLRDRHMAETLMRLQLQLSRRRPVARMVVWAHNSHVGDARGTEMGRDGQITLGQLIRREQGGDCARIGFTTYHGSVTAARHWDAPAEHLHVLPALAASYEHIFHHTGLERFTVLPNDLQSTPVLQQPLLERAIGVVYRPESERQSHYFEASMALQFDAVIHIDSTRAVEPLEHMAPAAAEELAETWPFGI